MSKNNSFVSFLSLKLPNMTVRNGAIRLVFQNCYLFLTVVTCLFGSLNKVVRQAKQGEAAAKICDQLKRVHLWFKLIL